MTTQANSGADGPASHDSDGPGFGAGLGAQSGGSAPERSSEGGATTTSASGSSRRGSRGGRRRKKRPAGEDAGAPGNSEATGEAGPAAREGDGERAKTGTRRRRRKRSKRTASRSDGEQAAEEGEGAETAASEPSRPSRSSGADSDTDEQVAPARRKSRSRRSRRSKKAPHQRGGEDAPQSGARSSSTSPSSEGDRDDEEAADGDRTARKRKRRGSRGGRGRKKASDSPVGVDVIPGEEDDFPPERDSDSEEEDEGTSRRGSRRGSKTTERKRAKKVDDSAPRTQRILVNAVHHEETRVAVVEDQKIIDFHMTVERYKSYVNDIYRGRVVNLEPAIGAAFVDFGQGRNGFLHASDVMAVYGEKGFKLEHLLTATEDDDIGGDGVDMATDGDGDKGKPKARGNPRRTRKRLPIESMLKKGSMVVAQITKDAIGDKGPTLTTYISIPGRYLVLMPSLSRTGVSRKIEDERERKRLKRILQSLAIPEGMGVIVRTAGTGQLKRDLKRDLDYLLAVWADFTKRLVSGRNPMPLYQESDVAIRTMRDLFSEKTESVLVDDHEVYERMVEFTEKLMPENVERIVPHDGTRPLLHEYGVEQDFERIFSRRVELPSGGSIVFDQTEALVAIDVNSGRTRADGAGFEDIALKTNLEAVPEIARQIRLRDLGGIIVCDFIDMMRMSSRRLVERALRDAFGPDRARSKMGRISQFGLLELTRQRLGPGLSKLVFDVCQTCRGTGHERTAGSKAQAILRRLGSALLQKGFNSVELRAHPDTIAYLKAHNQKELDELQERSGRELTLTAVEAQVEDSVLRYLRTDGREVRPGGRRKR